MIMCTITHGFMRRGGRKARVRFGGKTGRTFTLKAGDVAALPSGTGHQSLSASADFLVLGLIHRPERTTSAQAPRIAPSAQANPKVGLPRKDPIYGSEGFL
jgi:uncharacterized protein YjlB